MHARAPCGCAPASRTYVERTNQIRILVIATAINTLDNALTLLSNSSHSHKSSWHLHISDNPPQVETPKAMEVPTAFHISSNLNPNSIHTVAPTTKPAVNGIFWPRRTVGSKSSNFMFIANPTRDYGLSQAVCGIQLGIHFPRTRKKSVNSDS